MSEQILLSKVFRVESRFYRSVDLARDHSDAHAIDGYIITPLCRQILGRVASGLQRSAKTRAWSITGPYGTGKSACCLFIAQAFGEPDLPSTKAARTALRAVDPDLCRRVFAGKSPVASHGLLPALVVGGPKPITVAVLEGINHAASAALVGAKKAGVCGRAKRMLRGLRRGVAVSVRDVADLLVECAAAAVATRRRAGVLLIVDELGKLLEYAARHPDRADVFTLQALAEAASRSGDAPVLFVTVLHQAFDRYAANLELEQQQEWAKVQGRFEDIGFLESRDQMLNLVAAAVVRKGNLAGYDRVAAKEAAKALSLSIVPQDSGGNGRLGTVLERCAPLHPVTAMALEPLFRSRLAQNERSLFAFLTSGEAYGFQSFLSDEANAWSRNVHRPFYRIDRLYDYVVAALGSTLMATTSGKRWAEIGDAIDRLPPDAHLDHSVVKAVGMLGIVGDNRYLKASRAVVVEALDDGRTTQADIQESLEGLRQRGILTYRHHSGSYAIWEGSDVDLDARYSEGKDRVGDTRSLASLLQSQVSLRPYVAKRHLHQTGTLRYFVPILTGESSVHEATKRPLGDADGAVIFVLPDSGMVRKQLLDDVTALSQGMPKPLKEQVLFAVPRELHGLSSALSSVLAWEWVAKNTPELEGDRVARKELAARLSLARQQLEQVCAEHFGGDAAHGSCTWIWAGQDIQFGSTQEFGAKLSEICDLVFGASPLIHNELVNRRKISSAAAAARRSLLGRMWGAPEQPCLGIEGTPPEMAIYASVLERTGLHHPDGKGWSFGPAKKDRGRMGPLWDGIDRFFESTERGRLSVADLFDLLARPPYGIKQGLLPLLFVARLAQDPFEIAIYEDGSFLPEPDAAMFERLSRQPARFEVQRYRICGVREDVMRRLALLVNPDSKGGKASLLAVLRPLFAFVGKLPPYSRNTRHVSPPAAAVRDAVLAAREPHHLLFDEIPRALGAVPLGALPDKKQVEVFFSALKVALVELQGLYNRLLDDVEAKLRHALSASGRIDAVRQQLVCRVTPLAGMVSDLRLKAFILRLADANLGDVQWIESVAACVLAKPPSHWGDADISAFDVGLAELSGQVRRVEEIATERSASGAPPGSRALRLGVTEGGGAECRRVVYVTPENEEAVRLLVEKMEAIVGEAQDAAVVTAALAELAKRMSAPSPSSEKDRR